MPLGAFAPLPLRLGGSATEGISAAQHARLSADLVALKRVQPLAKWHFSQIATPPYTVTITQYRGQNGAGLAYAPTVTDVNGGVDFQWPSQYFEDEYGVQWPFRIRMCEVTPHGSSAWLGNYENIARGIRALVFDISGGLQVPTAGCTVTVW